MGVKRPGQDPRKAIQLGIGYYARLLLPLFARTSLLICGVIGSVSPIVKVCTDVESSSFVLRSA